MTGVSAALALSGAQMARADAPAATEPTIPAPAIPDKTFSIAENGAVGDGTTMNTAAIQKTIDAAEAAGGGTVLVPSGNFLTASITLASNINLKVDQGGTLTFSNDPTQYKVAVDPKHESNEGNGKRYQNFIEADDCHDIEISGTGTIDGQGQKWWDMFLPFKSNMKDPAAPAHRPLLIVLKHCQRVQVQDIHLTDSPMLHLVTEGCQDVLISGINIKSPSTSPNTDGIDPSGKNYLIKGCTIDTGDDNIALKPVHGVGDGGPACQDFLVENCTFLHGHGVSIGGQTPGGLKHLVVRDCTFDSGDQGMRLKAPRGEGGLVEDVTYENLTMKNIKKIAIEITSYYPETKIPKNWSKEAAQPVDETTPIWRDIHVTNVTITDSKQAGLIVGLPEMHVSDVVFTNVTIDAKKPFKIANADGIKFVNSQITVPSGNALDISAANSTVEGIDPVTGRPN